MFSLSILLPDSPAWSLHPSAPQPPLEGLRWLERRPSGDDEEVIECALLGLRGAGIRAWLEGLQAVLAQVSRTPFALLERRSQPADDPLYASLYEGWLESEPLNQTPARGSFSLRLYLRRSAHWRKPAAALPLSNANGSRLEMGISLYNHHDGDAAHQNFADIAAADLSGGLPAPLSLRLRLIEPAGQTLRQVIVAAGSRLTLGGEAFPHALEGEDAVPAADCTASSLLSGGASGGAYRRVQWTRPDSAALLRWTLSGYRLGFCAGRTFRPVLRLISPPPEGVYLRWRLLDGNANLLEESPAAPAQPQQSLQVTAGLNLPPRWLPQIIPAGLTLELRAESRDAGLKTLDVDFLHLLPADEGWLQLQALNGASAGEVWLDGERQLAYARSAGGETAFTHTLAGRPPHLLPGSDYRLYLLWETESGAPLNSRCEAQAFYAPRVMLP